MSPSPNIVIFAIHDLGQFLRCYDIQTVQTPHIDSLAADGILFRESFCCAPQCSPSRASLFTGRYPHSNGVMGLTHANFAWDYHPEEKHLAQFLLDRGYQTAACGHIHETRSPAARIGIQKHFGDALAVNAINTAIECLKGFSSEPDKPFYLQLGLFEPHRFGDGNQLIPSGFLGPGIEPDSSLGITIPGYLVDDEGTRGEIAELQGAIRHLDLQVGRFLTALRELRLEQNTLIVFTADHGVALPRAKCNLYDPGIEVPLILRWPQQGWTGGKVLHPMISNVDVLPTLLELLDVEIPESVQGRSFLPLLQGLPYEPRNELFAQITYHDYYDPRRAIRTNTHKLIANFSAAYAFMDPSQSWRPRSTTKTPVNPGTAYHPHFELYDLVKDPWEQVNLAEDPASLAIREDLMKRLYAHLVEIDDPLLKGAVTSPMHRSVQQILEDSLG